MTTTITQAHADKMNALCAKVERTLRDGGVWNCGIYPDREWRDIIVEIYNGDWKHDHLRAKWLIGEMGGKHLGEWTLDDGESDCYSAGHRFRFA